MKIDTTNNKVNYKRLLNVLSKKPKLLINNEDFKVYKLNKNNLCIMLDGLGTVEGYYISKYI